MSGAPNNHASHLSVADMLSRDPRSDLFKTEQDSHLTREAFERAREPARSSAVEPAPERTPLLVLTDPHPSYARASPNAAEFWFPEASAKQTDQALSKEDFVTRRTTDATSPKQEPKRLISDV